MEGIWPKREDGWREHDWRDRGFREMQVIHGLFDASFT